MANSVLSYIINVVKKGDGDKATLTSLQTLKSVMGGVTAVAAAATGAYIVLDRTLGEASRKTVKYAEEVRKLSSITKQDAEATSRLIQTMDDFKITTDQLTVASKKLSTQGLSPTVETMAQLSDEYIKINDGAKRAEFLTKNFGKAGLDMAEAMQAGGNAIRSQSEQVKKNLILTEKQMRDAWELERAQDELREVSEAYALAIGNKLIPMQTESIRGVVALTEETNNLNREEKIRLEMIEKEKRLRAVDSATQSYMAMAEAIEIAEAAQADMSDELRTVVDLAKLTGKEYKKAMDQWIISSYQAKLAADGVLDEADVRKVLDYQLKLGMLSKAEYEAAVKALGLKDAIDALHSKDIFVTTTMITQMGQAGDPIQIAQQNIPTGGGGGGAGWIYKAGGYGKGPDGKIRYWHNPSTGAYKAMGGMPDADWTWVGEHGKELIDPGGYIHSNAESRRLIAAGVTPFKGLAGGGPVFGSDMYGTGGSSITANKIAAMTTNVNTPSQAFREQAKKSGGGGSSAVSPTAAVVATAQAAQVSDVAAQSVQKSASSINESNVKMQQTNLDQAQVNIEQSTAMLAELRGLRNDIKTIIPKAIQEGYQRVVSS